MFILLCAACDCDPNGTETDMDTDLPRVCDKMTDPAEDPPMVSGQCHCKTNVGGDRCDMCRNGYWNFTLENPDGCQGTILSFEQKNLSFAKKLGGF